jgi:anti-sigma B factor antagonist
VALTDHASGLEFWVSLAESPQGGSIVTVFGELDAATAPRLRSTLQQALDAGGDIEVDLRACSFVDSSGIAALVWGAWRMKEDPDRKLVLLGARERVRRILDLAGVAGHSAIVLEQPDAPD